jgi:hypothetical protein
VTSSPASVTTGPSTSASSGSPTGIVPIVSPRCTSIEGSRISSFRRVVSAGNETDGGSHSRSRGSVISPVFALAATTSGEAR